MNTTNTTPPLNYAVYQKLETSNRWNAGCVLKQTLYVYNDFVKKYTPALDLGTATGLKGGKTKPAQQEQYLREKLAELRIEPSNVWLVTDGRKLR